MLPKVNRPTKKDIKELFKQGSFIVSSNFTLKFLKNRPENQAKIAFIVPKTLSNKATVRNSLRRKGYRAVLPNIPTLPKNFLGAFVFGKKSVQNFGGKVQKLSKIKQIKALELEIKDILDKIK